MREGVLFFKAFLTDTKGVASFKPSSRRTVQRICELIPRSGNHTIVEYGPGTGAVTKGLLRKISDDSKLILIETNLELYNHLRQNIKDKRISLVHDDAEKVKSVLEMLLIGEIDYIISGIPFSEISPEKRDRILESTRYVLSDGGIFIAYQLKDAIKKPLERYFKHVRESKRAFPASLVKIYVAWN